MSRNTSGCPSGVRSHAHSAFPGSAPSSDLVVLSDYASHQHVAGRQQSTASSGHTPSLHEGVQLGLTTPQVHAASSLQNTPELTGLQNQLCSTQSLLQDMKARAYTRSRELRSKPHHHSEAGKGAWKPAHTATDEACKRSVQPVKSSTTQPDSVSALQSRLAPYFAALQQTALTIRSTFDTVYKQDGQVVASVACKGCSVGRASSTTSSRLKVCTDRLDYVFHHPEHGKVSMLMYLKDMDQCDVYMKNLLLTFHVVQPLHHFTMQYDPAGLYEKGHTGCLTCTLESRQEALALVQALQPLLPCLIVHAK